MAAPLQFCRSICRFCGRKLHLRGGNRLHYSNKPQIGKVTDKWKPVIGLEIHAQIESETKIFSGSSFRSSPIVNSEVSFLDCALPGTLPVLNRRCVEAGVMTAISLGCDINKVSHFDRKHYFYADLPVGYQITQQRQPLGKGGHVTYQLFTPGGQAEERSARLVQLQLEQDSGKSVHNEVEKISLINLNRAGVGLMEIVTEPDFSSPDEVVAFVDEIKGILKRIGTCSCKGESSLRVDVNVSVHKPDEPLGVRSEVKNLLTTRGVRTSVEYEIKRQIKILENGGTVVNETRSLDSETGETAPMRDKEVQQDYRFMPEPNLPPLRLYDNASSVPEDREPDSVILIDRLREGLPALPKDVRIHMNKEYGVPWPLTVIIVDEDGLYDVFEGLVAGRDVKKLALFLVNEYLGALRERKLAISESPLSVSALNEILDMEQSGFINRPIALKVMNIVLDQPDSGPRQVVIDNDWTKITDKEVLRRECEQVIATDTSAVEAYKANKKGRKKQRTFFYGKVAMRLNERQDNEVLGIVLDEVLAQLQ